MSEAQATPSAPDDLLDPVEAMRLRGKSPELAAVLAWLIPGAGHLYAGHLIKGLGAVVLVLGLYVSGLVASRGDAVSLRAEVGHEYAFLAQVGAGLPTALGLAYSHGRLPKLQPPDLSHPSLLEDPAYAARLGDVDTGLLFTMIAGLLNLLLIHDALNGVPGALGRRVEERRRRERLDALRAEVLAARQAGEEPAP